MLPQLTMYKANYITGNRESDLTMINRRQGQGVTLKHSYRHIEHKLLWVHSLTHSGTGKT